MRVCRQWFYLDNLTVTNLHQFRLVPAFLRIPAIREEPQIDRFIQSKKLYLRNYLSVTVPWECKTLVIDLNADRRKENKTAYLISIYFEIHLDKYCRYKRKELYLTVHT